PGLEPLGFDPAELVAQADLGDKGYIGQHKYPQPLEPQGGKARRRTIQAHTIIEHVKRSWLIPIRGKATHRKKALGWYAPATGDIRLQDVRDIDAALHELGHHWDRQADNVSTGKTLPKAVAAELTRLGRALYGNKRPAGGYRSEGF